MKTLSALLGRGRFVLVLVLLAACFAVTSAVAQAPPPPVNIKPPTPSQPDEPPVVMNILAMVVVVGLACGAALIPSKRGHQD